MAPEKRMARLREAGVNPTMQRLAILEFLEGTKAHPTADDVYAAVHKTCPTIARATVYNTLEALTRSGTILQLTVDPGAARYDADTGPHVHFRCRLCGKVYDLEIEGNHCLNKRIEGHDVEAVHTYAFGVCASCLDAKSVSETPGASQGSKKPARKSAGGEEGRAP